MSQSSPPRVYIVGAGPAGLMAAEQLALAGASTRVLDRMPSPGRKFLMAGRGGLNLTHSEPLERFLTRYGSAAERLEPLIRGFDPNDVRHWSERLGVPTFVGTSGRVFPQSLKASPLLRAWLRRLAALGVDIAPQRDVVRLTRDRRIEVIGPDGAEELVCDALVLATGGASWPRLGSTGAWVGILAEVGVGAASLRASNCGVLVDWPTGFREGYAGAPLKGAVFSTRGKSLRGEAVVTAAGLEGGAIYALSEPLRSDIDAFGFADLTIDLRPDISVADLARRISRARTKDSWSQKMRKAGGLSPVAAALLRATTGGALTGRDAEDLAQAIKNVRVRLTGTAPLERAISSAGGVRFDDLDEGLMLRSLPGVFVCGEMLDFDAPTGGYLLQAAFSSGFAAGRAAAAWLGLTPAPPIHAPNPTPDGQSHPDR